jgi:bifunctional DNA-binding transcriptional regulator/antitoxin component of YhaV-PrlF toxin-antitoxin module
MSLVTVKNKFQVVIPQSVRDQIDVSVGDVFEATAQRGKIVFQPKAIIDRDEYTPAQRRVKRCLISSINRRNNHGSSLHAKKYDEATDVWQARVNRDWRFYFTIENDTYVIHKIISHPK